MFPYMIALLISLFAGQWSHLCLVLFFSQRSTSEKRLMQSSNKRGRTMCWCSSEELLHRSEGCLYRGFWSRTTVCMIVAMHGCAVYTLSLLILWISTHSRECTCAHNLRGIPIFFFYLVPDAHKISCRHVPIDSHTPKLTHAHTSSSYVP